MDIGKIYKKAWNIAWNTKPLWIFGVLVVAFSGGSSGLRSNFNSSSNFGGESSDPNFNQILRDFKNAFSEDPMGKNFQGNQFEIATREVVALLKEIFFGIPTSTWIIFILAILVSMVIGIIFTIIIKGYSMSSLIGGIKLKQVGSESTLKTISKDGLKHLKSMIWLSLIPGIIVSIISIVVILPVAVVFMISVPVGAIISMLLILPYIVFLIIFSMAMIWARRILVIENKSGWESFKAGFVFLKSSGAETIILGLLNSVLSCAFGCGFGIVMILVFGILALPVFGGFLISEYSLVITLPIALVFGFVILILFGLATGIYTVFNYSTWNLLYEDIVNENNIDSNINWKQVQQGGTSNG